MFTLNFLDKFIFGESFDFSIKSSLAIWSPLLKGSLLLSLIPMVQRSFSKWQYLKDRELTNSNFKVIHDKWEKQ